MSEQAVGQDEVPGADVHLRHGHPVQDIIACTNCKDDPANKEMSTRQTNNRLSPEAGKAASTNRKTQQSAINNKPGSTVKRRG